jgi:YVTN family beta-propeller protein
MKVQKAFVPCLYLAGPLLGLLVLFHAIPAWAVNDTCANGQVAPCAEDVIMNQCNECHTIKITGGNRDGTDRIITGSTGTKRHELDPKIADWTSIVQAMITKGSTADPNLTPGYLNTNYCDTCTGPILGSPVASNLTDTGATLTWSTSAIGFEDEMTDTVLFYGTNAADVLLGPGCSSCQKFSDPTPVGNHTVTLTGLSSLTKYYIVNQATSSRGTTRSKYASSFTTKRSPGGGGGGGGQCTGGTEPIPARLYASNHPSINSTDSPRIIVIDPLTQSQIDSIPASGAPGELAFTPDGSTVYAVEGINVSVIDVLSDVELTSLARVGDLFNHLAVSPDGKKLYLLYRKSSGTATLEIKVFDLTDPTDPTLSTTISDPIFNGCYGPLGLAVRPDGSKLYLACRPADSTQPDRFFMVDTATNTPTQTATFSRDASNYTFINAFAIKPDGTRVYVARANTSGSTVEVFDGTTGTNVASIGLPANALPRAGVVTPDGTKLYVVDQVLGTHVIDTATNTRLLTMPQTKSRGFDDAITPDGVHIYTTLASYIFVLDKVSDTWVSTITGDFTAVQQIISTPGQAGTPPVCPPPSGGGPTPSRIYVSNNASITSGDTDRIIVIDPVAQTEITSLQASGTPGELAFTPDGSTVYAVEGINVSVIDVLSDVELTSLARVGDLFNHLAVSPDGKKLYLLYRKSSGTATLEIKVFDLTDPTDPTLSTTISDPIFNGCYGPLGLAVRPDGSKLYLACRPADSTQPDRFFMVDTATNTPTQTATFSRDASNYTFINAFAIKPDGTRVYVARANTSGSTVEVFDGTTGTNVASIGLPANALPRAGVVTPDGTKLYVVDQVLGTHVIDTATNTRLLTMPQTQSRGLDIGIAPDGTKLYSTLTGNVFVLDPSTNTWLSTITGDFSSAAQITVTPGHP